MVNFISIHRIIVCIILLTCVVLISCSGRKNKLDVVSLDMESLPMMHTEDVVSLISDSGVTRYRLVAKIWDYVTEEKENYWYFPEGFYVEKFDSVFQVEGSIQSDTAYYFEKQSLWHLIGNVEVLNLEKDKIETEEMFWDEKLQKIYSDKWVRIEQQNQVTIGIGFESNQDMTHYNIFNTQAVFEVYEDEESSREAEENPEESNKAEEQTENLQEMVNDTTQIQ